MLFPFSPFEKTTKRLANIFNLKWLWVLFGLPEISLAAGQRVWAWHLRVLTMTGLCGISSRCLVVAPFFFPSHVKVSLSLFWSWKIVWFIDKTPMGGRNFDIGFFVCSGASRNTDLLMSQQETWPIRVSETESSCIVVVAALAIPISFCGFSIFSADSTAHLLQHFN